MLFYKGYRVDPGELEELVSRFRGVRAAVVVGRPDPSVGELPVALVVPHSPGAVDIDGLLARVAGAVPRYKRIHDVVFVDELPATPEGRARAASRTQGR